MRKDKQHVLFQTGNTTFSLNAQPYLQHEVVERVANAIVGAGKGVGEVVGLRLVLGVVTELLGRGGIAKEEGEGGEDVVARGRKGRRSREVLGHVGLGGDHF